MNVSVVLGFQASNSAEQWGSIDGSTGQGVGLVAVVHEKAQGKL